MSDNETKNNWIERYKNFCKADLKKYIEVIEKYTNENKDQIDSKSNLRKEIVKINSKNSKIEFLLSSIKEYQKKFNIKKEKIETNGIKKYLQDLKHLLDKVKKTKKYPSEKNVKKLDFMGKHIKEYKKKFNENQNGSSNSVSIRSLLKMSKSSGSDSDSSSSSSDDSSKNNLSDSGSLFDFKKLDTDSSEDSDDFFGPMSISKILNENKNSSRQSNKSLPKDSSDFLTLSRNSLNFRTLTKNAEDPYYGVEVSSRLFKTGGAASNEVLDTTNKINFSIFTQKRLKDSSKGCNIICLHKKSTSEKKWWFSNDLQMVEDPNTSDFFDDNVEKTISIFTRECQQEYKGEFYKKKGVKLNYEEKKMKDSGIEKRKNTKEENAVFDSFRTKIKENEKTKNQDLKTTVSSLEPSNGNQKSKREESKPNNLNEKELEYKKKQDKYKTKEGAKMIGGILNIPQVSLGGLKK